MDVHKRATSLYQSLSLIPSIDSACLLPSTTPSTSATSSTSTDTTTSTNTSTNTSTSGAPYFPVLIKCSQTDVVQARKRSFLVSKSISQKGNVLATAPFPFDVSAAALVAPSPSGLRLAVVRIEGDKKDEPFIEIWESYRLVHNIACKGKGHGSIYTDDWFGSLEWSPDEKYVAYIAEPVVTNSAFWDKDQKDASKLGHKYDYREDWGESFIGLSSPSIFILEIDKENIISVKLDHKNLSVGQVIWAPNGGELVFTGWPVTNRRLGLKFCYNRESAIYRVMLADILDSQKKEQEADDKSKADVTSFVKAHLVSDPPKSRAARFPRFSPDGSILVYLAAENMITHNGGAKLLKIDWPTKSTSPVGVVLDTVARPATKEEFPGLFLHALPRRCFLDDSHILSHTQWRSALVPVVIDLNQKKAHRVSIPGQYFSAVVHDVVGKCFLLVCSSPATPPTLVFGQFESSEFSVNHTSFSVIHAPFNTDILNGIEFTCKDVTPTSPPTSLPFEVIFTHPKIKQGETKSFPLLLFPHGGPHSAFTGEYSTYVAFLVLMGYSLLSINYRGSLGFGTDFVDVLPGRCGELDVKDCVDAAHYALGLEFVDPQRVGVIGGSHGGFLAAHLIGGAFEKLKFKACAMRNPVVNIASMCSTTDIPDWCFVETGATTTTTSLVSTTFVASQEQLLAMHRASPINHIATITTPTLLLLGEVDKRVPPSQGIELHHALQERNVPSRVQFYPKNGHGLAGCDADPDQAVNTVLFLHQYLQ